MNTNNMKSTTDKINSNDDETDEPVNVGYVKDDNYYTITVNGNIIVHEKVGPYIYKVKIIESFTQEKYTAKGNIILFSYIFRNFLLNIKYVNKLKLLASNHYILLRCLSITIFEYFGLKLVMEEDCRGFVESNTMKMIDELNIKNIRKYITPLYSVYAESEEIRTLLEDVIFQNYSEEKACQLLIKGQEFALRNIKILYLINDEIFEEVNSSLCGYRYNELIKKNLIEHDVEVGEICFSEDSDESTMPLCYNSKEELFADIQPNEDSLRLEPIMCDMCRSNRLHNQKDIYTRIRKYIIIWFLLICIVYTGGIFLYYLQYLNGRRNKH